MGKVDVLPFADKSWSRAWMTKYSTVLDRKANLAAAQNGVFGRLGLSRETFHKHLSVPSKVFIGHCVIEL